MADINDIKNNIAGSIRSFNKWRDDRQIKREEKSIKKSEKRVAAHQAEMEKVRKGGLWQKSKDWVARDLGIRTKLERMESGSRGKQLDLDYMKLGTSKEEMFSNVSRSQLKIDLPDFKKVGLTKNSDSDLSKINVSPMNESRLNQSFVSTIKDEFAKINNNTKIIESHLQDRDSDIEKIEDNIDRTVNSISTYVSELTKRVNTVESELQNLRANNKTTQPSSESAPATRSSQQGNQGPSELDLATTAAGGYDISRFLPLAARATIAGTAAYGMYRGLQVIGEANEQRDKALGITPDMPQEEIENRRRAYNSARKRSAYNDLRAETAALKQQYSTEPQSTVGLTGTAKGSSQVRGYLNRARQRQQSSQKKGWFGFGGFPSEPSRGGAFGYGGYPKLLTPSDVYEREQVEAQKSQFMKFGQLPPGFEFMPGHMGRLGQPEAVAAAGAMPLGGYGGVPGVPGMPSGGYATGGGAAAGYTTGPTANRGAEYSQSISAPLSGDYARDRTERFAKELEDPRIVARLYNTSVHEVGTNPIEQQKFLETVFNRAMHSNKSLNQILNPRYGYESAAINTNINTVVADNFKKGPLSGIMAGSNWSRSATENASNAPGNPLADKRLSQGATGKWTGGDRNRGELLYNWTATSFGKKAAEYQKNIEEKEKQQKQESTTQNQQTNAPTTQDFQQFTLRDKALPKPMKLGGPVSNENQQQQNQQPMKLGGPVSNENQQQLQNQPMTVLSGAQLVQQQDASKFNTYKPPVSDSIPQNIIDTARNLAISGGPEAVSKFMTKMGYPKHDAWCGDFAASVVTAAGGTPPKNPQVASNWRNYGKEIDPKDIKPGDIAVRKPEYHGRLGSGRTGETGSHVTIVDQPDIDNGNFMSIGGNQGKFSKKMGIEQYQFYRADSPTANKEIIEMYNNIMSGKVSAPTPQPIPGTQISKPIPGMPGVQTASPWGQPSPGATGEVPGTQTVQPTEPISNISSPTSYTNESILDAKDTSNAVEPVSTSIPDLYNKAFPQAQASTIPNVPTPDIAYPTTAPNVPEPEVPTPNISYPSAAPSVTSGVSSIDRATLAPETLVGGARAAAEVQQVETAPQQQPASPIPQPYSGGPAVSEDYRGGGPQLAPPETGAAQRSGEQAQATERPALVEDAKKSTGAVGAHETTGGAPDRSPPGGGPGNRPLQSGFESQPATPGSGGSGSYGRCFINFVGFIISSSYVSDNILTFLQLLK